MSDYWDVYITNSENNVATIRLDLGIFNDVPIQGYKYLIKTFIGMKGHFFNKNKHLDMKLLVEIEDDILDNLLQKDIHFVGIFTSQLSRYFYFYTKDKDDLEETIKLIILKYKNIQFKIESVIDENWNFYKHELYPDKYGWRCILDRSIVEKLKANGDTLSEPRETSHWIYFKDSESRKVFLDKVKQQGFILVSIEDLHNQGEYPCQLVINRVDLVDWSSIYKVTSYLMYLANENHGDYDGWETYVIK